MNKKIASVFITHFYDDNNISSRLSLLNIFSSVEISSVFKG